MLSCGWKLKNQKRRSESFLSLNTQICIWDFGKRRQTKLHVPATLLLCLFIFDSYHSLTPARRSRTAQPHPPSLVDLALSHRKWLSVSPGLRRSRSSSGDPRFFVLFLDLLDLLWMGCEFSVWLLWIVRIFLWIFVWGFISGGWLVVRSGSWVVGFCSGGSWVTGYCLGFISGGSRWWFAIGNKIVAMGLGSAPPQPPPGFDSGELLVVGFNSWVFFFFYIAPNTYCKIFFGVFSEM